MAIESFSSFFEEQERLVSSLRGGPEAFGASSDPEIRVAVLKKVLYCTMLDSLAGVRYHGQNLNNHHRFIAFVRDHGGWPDGEKISVPILVERLPATAPASRLRDHLQAKLRTQDPNAGNTVPASLLDEPQDELNLLAADDSERASIAQSQQYELFYKYRNFLVHEFREPGYGADAMAPGACEPRYHRYINDPRWRLLYPQSFLSGMIRSALSSLSSYFRSAGIDPSACIKDSSAWCL